MFRIILGFIAGIFYGAVVTVQTPDGMIAKAAALVKMIFF